MTVQTEKRDSLIFYEQWHDALSQLPGDKYKEAMGYIIDYACNGVIPDPDDLAIKLFLMGIIPVIDSNNRRYENGKKGGRPRKDA